MSKSLIPKRRQSRFLLTQALYQWSLSEDLPKDILLQFQLNPQFQKGDQAYFIECFDAITAQADTLDEQFGPFLDRSLTELDPVEKAILRLATYELMYRLDIPYRVVINEALELAKTFGATDSHKYINGVVDKVAHKLRKAEMA
ncbi:MAG: NusB antitermination factor [Gammaproteobacteria bacterium]|jgi:N utilization substance protein B|nr:NusB antitermination factor [Gammaproteobacteria bacterium]